MSNKKELLDILKSREDHIWSCMQESLKQGNEKDRAHYVGWYRGIMTSRFLIEFVLKDD